ncbi:hypothetical protein D910_12178 [Dendroctonus ponderosae]|uniref:HAT C-terminal dimerisation domain-containing protein n=1 Tax=Dendroctonus ponderosae TaxID=77166 RepID=U4UXA6_DENPD|nr:hypothetical protein D910_12178 [Dendroctonus ponderosae]
MKEEMDSAGLTKIDKTTHKYSGIGRNDALASYIDKEFCRGRLTFSEEPSDSAAGKQHNENVTKNRYVLSKIINCLKFCGAFELALRGRDESDSSQNPGIFRGLINFAVELDSTLGEHMQKASVFEGMSKEIQNELLDCILDVCHEEITKEIKKASVLAVIADETMDVFAKTQLVVILRYTRDDGEPVEQYCGKFPEDKLSTICSTYPHIVKERLRTELSVTYSRSDCREINGTLPLLKFLIKNNLDETMSETKRTLEIVVTTPMTTAGAERCFSTLKRIKTFLRNSMTEDRLSALSMISNEKTFISEIDKFNEMVISSQICN